jgi:hypothetical protein
MARCRGSEVDKVSLRSLFSSAKVRRICSLQQTVGPSMEKVIIHCGRGDSTSYLHEAFVLVHCVRKIKKARYT